MQVFVLAAVGLWLFLLLLSAFWWRRLKGLSNLPDGRDWLWGKTGFCPGELIQLSADGWGCTLAVSCLAWGDPTLGSAGSMIGLMVTSKRAYSKGNLPGLLLPVPPSLWGAPADPHLHRRPSNTSRWFWSVTCRVTAPLLWVSVRAWFCLYPPRLESLFPSALWKSYNRIPLAFKIRFPGDSQFPLLDPQSGKPDVGFRTFITVENFFDLLFSSLWVAHKLAVTEFDFIMIATLLPSHCGFFFVFGCWISGWWILPVDSCSTASWDFGALAEDECMPFYSVILNRKLELPNCSICAGEFCGQRSLVDYSPRSHKELDTTEWLKLSVFSLVISLFRFSILDLVLLVVYF